MKKGTDLPVWLLLLFLVVALSGLVACGDSTTAPDPVPSPSPTASATPSPAPVNLCEISRTGITFERTDPNKPNPPIVTSWPRGVIPIAHARPAYRYASHPDFDQSKCPAFDRVRWWCDSGSVCEFIGDQTAPDIFLKINQSGLHCVHAQPLDLTEDGEACVTVVG